MTSFVRGEGEGGRERPWWYCMWKKATEYQRRKRRGWWGKDRVDPDTIMHRIASRAPGEARHAIIFSLVDFVLLRGIIWKGRGTKERKNEGAGART